MKKVLILVFVLIACAFITPKINAQFAECDECGYCIGREAPGNWKECKQCIYPKASDSAESNQSVEIKTNTTSGRLEQITKFPGAYYTQLGCLNVGSGSFSDPSAAGGVLNFLLTKLIFPIVGVLSFISLIYGAFLLMTAQGASEQISRGKSYIVGAIVGLLFTLSAILIVNIIAGDILRIPGFSRASQITAIAAGRCEANAVNRGQTPCPNLRMIVRDATGKELKNIHLGEIKGPNGRNPQSVDFKTYTVTAPDKFDPTKFAVSVVFLDDYNPAPEDKNIFLQSIAVDNYTCSKINYLSSRTIPPTLAMYWDNHEAVCEEWVAN